MAKCPPFPAKKGMSEKADAKYDKKNGIKEDSKADKRMDKKMGVRQDKK